MSVLLVVYHCEAIAFVEALGAAVREEKFVCTVFLLTRVKAYRIR